jgi:hypothetical protein
VTEASGWRPLGESRGSSGQAAFETSPFTKLARVHALAIAVDTLVAMALAGSLFFSIPTGEARGRVALYLLLTMAPFAVVAPLIGPALDRAAGGRRWMVILSSAGRAVVCVFMARHIDSLLLFPEAFLLLVMSKAYLVTKSALVPTVVRSDEELVEANAKLSLLAGVVGLVAGIPGVVLLKLAGPEWTVGVAAVVAVGAAIAGTRLPATRIATEPAGPAEEAELRGASIVLAASAMGLLRGVVGFLTFLLAFDLRGGGYDTAIPVGLSVGRAVRLSLDMHVEPLGGGGGHPAWHFGIVLAVSVIGSLFGAAIAPFLRSNFSEEHILVGSLGSCVAAATVAALQGGVFGAAIIASVVGIAASTGKLAFDSLVQRDAPDANRGRSFARFETRFQLVWVVGAFLPVAFPIPARFGFLIVAGVAGFAAFSYVAGRRAVTHQTHRGHGWEPRPPDAGPPMAEEADALAIDPVGPARAPGP